HPLPEVLVVHPLHLHDHFPAVIRGTVEVKDDFFTIVRVADMLGGAVCQIGDAPVPAQQVVDEFDEDVFARLGTRKNVLETPIAADVDITTDARLGNFFLFHNDL